MAFSKKHKNELVEKYTQWLNESQAVFMLQYNKMGMKDIDAMRKKVREIGGQAHVIKNTLLDIALKNAGFNYDQELEGTTLAGFAFSDAAQLAKVFSDAAKAEIYTIKGGFLDKHAITDKEVKALADLPPLPVMRAQLLGTILAPASKLVRTLAEPAREVAAVVKAYSEK